MGLSPSPMEQSLPHRVVQALQRLRSSCLILLAPAGLSGQLFAAPGPGLTQTTFTAAEVGTEVFRFPAASVGPQPTMIDFHHGYLYVGAAQSVDATVPGKVTWWNISNPRVPTLITSVAATGNKPHMAGFWADRMID